MIAEGIYFNLSNEDYHNDEAVSCSGVKLLLQNPLKYWWNSPMNPQKKKSDTKALRLGRLYHTLLLEPEKFKSEFLVLPKGKLTKSYLKENGLEQEDIDSLTIIREPDIELAQTAINEIKGDSYYDNWFKGGYPEVSIFWKDKATGVNCRSRFDYLNTDFAIDYKSTQDISDIIKAIANFDYNLQSAIYQRGLATVLSKDDIFIDGNDEQKEWVKSLAKNPDFQFRFLFQEKTEPYITRSATLACDILQQSNVLFQTALNIYLMNFEKYGVEKWGSGYDEIEEIKATDMPVYWSYRMEAQTERKEGLPF